MSRRGIICDLLASSGGVAPVVMSFSGEQSCVYSKEEVSISLILSDYLSKLFLERVVDCCGAFGRDGGSCASRGNHLSGNAY